MSGGRLRNVHEYGRIEKMGQLKSSECNELFCFACIVNLFTEI